MISRVAYTIRNTYFRMGRLRFVEWAPVPWHSGTMASPRLCFTAAFVRIKVFIRSVFQW